MSLSNRPSLYQIDTGLWMSKLSGKIGDPLDDTPDSELDKPSRAGFRWIWPKNLAIEKSIIVQYDSFNDLKAI